METVVEREGTPEELGELAQSFRAQARAALKGLNATDVTPATRSALESLATSMLMAWSTLEKGMERREKLADVLKVFGEISEAIPPRLAAIETRLDALERRR